MLFTKNNKNNVRVRGASHHCRNIQEGNISRKKVNIDPILSFLFFEEELMHVLRIMQNVGDESSVKAFPIRGVRWRSVVCHSLCQV